MFRKLMQIMVVATLLVMIAMVGKAQESSECDDGDEFCALNWTITAPQEAANLPPDQNITASGKRPRGVNGFQVKLDKKNANGQWVEDESITYTQPINGTTWSVTFMKPTEGWPPGEYRIRIVRNGDDKATREFMILDQSY